jgi:prolyl-tRNA editing enzyme YbaK/EbsC (Cys-tRNA(Pro) deacylase)
LKGALDVARELLAAGVPHEIVRLPYGIQSADDLPEVLSLPASVCISVRMYDADGVLHALAVPATAPTRSITLARALGATHVEAASVDRVNALTGFAAGLVSPIGLPTGVVLVVDAFGGASSVLNAPTGDSGTVLKIRSRDLLVHSNARVAALSAPVAVPDEWPRAPIGAAAHTARRIALPAG